MSLFFVGRGDAILGRVERDANGKETKRINAHWENNPEGGSVAIGTLDPETMQPIGPAAIFGDWDAAGYLAQVLKELGPGRHINIPDMGDIIKGAIRDGFEPCEHCTAVGDCPDCVITKWKEEMNDEQNKN